jgi:hypothetical protein
MSRSPIKKPRLRRYVAAVTVTWALVLAVAWLVVSPARFREYVDVCGGFFLGMVAMYVAVHLYAWD